MNIKNLTDYELVQKCLNGEKDYFSEIISRHKNLVYSVVLRMVNNQDDANDLAQEVFIKIYKNLDKYFPDFKFSTWIVKITTNHVIDYRRKKKYETVPMDEIEYKLISEKSPEQNCLEKEERLMLNQLLNNLPDIYKVPIVLYHQQGLSYQEIADTINEPLSKVKNRIFRGRRILKEELLKLKEGENIELQQS
ncbi:RNA polymerase sigma factor [[Clostridium] colinum]|uniref:RNA polymerase sigma factor n=1 Tax=[Clostridium] colinum TaxID=36835 RepID=UPI0020256064|nr:sigma-70 family RNA polymerase sigma factor [[Clostridium] colinum]